MSSKSTYDLGLATALLTMGYELIELDKANPKKVKFVFKESKDIDKSVSGYWNDELKLSALALFNNQKNLKNRIYSNA